MTENGIVKIDRKQLYNELWEISASGIAKKYNIRYTDVLSSCKQFDVPIPPSGYWMKIKYGKAAKQEPLPDSIIDEVVIGGGTKRAISKIEKKKVEPIQDTCINVKKIIKESKSQTDEMILEKKEDVNSKLSILTFLERDEQLRVIEAASNLKLLPENSHLHKMIISYKKTVKEWNRNDKKEVGSKRIVTYSYDPPFLAGVIAEETLPRVYRFLDTLYHHIEALGGIVNEDLSLKIRDEHVVFEIIENQVVIDHVMSKQEAKELLVYKDAKKRNSWAREPKIRKQDYVFNGLLRIRTREHKFFRDGNGKTIESQLGEILIDLFEKSEEIRIKRLEREEAERERREEQRLREERREKYNDEVDKTNALINLVNDYEMATKIRTFSSNLKYENMNEEKSEFIDWVNKKADWFDPTINLEDEILGRRNHEQGEEYKKLSKRYY